MLFYLDLGTQYDSINILYELSLFLSNIPSMSGSPSGKSISESKDP